MKTFDGYMRGVNLGHWISQYDDGREEHWNSYITEDDFGKIASWGLDHVRLPVDYMLFESDEKPGEYLESGLKYVDLALEACRKNGLNMILDLHHAPGFIFSNTTEKSNDLFSNERQQERFVNIWRMFARRYAGEGETLAFELLNELVQETSEPWNALWQRTASEIEAVSPKRKIIIGGNRWNSADQLNHLALPDDDNIVYTFHCYAPMLFTHQRASWVGWLREYQRSVTYPLNTHEHREYFAGHDNYLLDRYDVVDKAAMADFLRPAEEFARTSGHALYCGEFGVHETADMASTLRWHSDIIDLFNEYGIGRSVWSYKGFARVTDPDGEVNMPLIEILAR